MRTILSKTFKYKDLISIINLKNKIKNIFGFSKQRQPFLIGKIEKEGVIDRKKLYLKLIKLGYQLNYFSFYDIDEILNVRKLYEDRQIHIRIFKDGEIRVHDELNYDFRPYEHLKAKSFRQVSDETQIKILEMIKDEN